MARSFKYSTKFNNPLLRVTASSLDEVSESLASSLADLSGLDAPKSLNLSKNPDLILTTYNGAVINRLNRNDDGIATATALAIKDNFIHKPTNVEHNKTRVVGHVVNVGWSSYGSNELLTDSDVSKMDDPFNLVLSSVVYRANEEKLSDALIDASDEGSNTFNSISTSWEIAFDDYNIVLGSKNVNEAEIISDPKHVEELSKHLKAYGGSGETPDGEYVGRLIVGGAESVLPIGFAFTTNPAAEVEGVLVRDFSDVLNEEDSSATTPENEGADSHQPITEAADITELMDLVRAINRKK